MGTITDIVADLEARVKGIENQPVASDLEARVKALENMIEDLFRHAPKVPRYAAEDAASSA